MNYVFWIFCIAKSVFGKNKRYICIFRGYLIADSVANIESRVNAVSFDYKADIFAFGELSSARHFKVRKIFFELVGL